MFTLKTLSGATGVMASLFGSDVVRLNIVEKEMWKGQVVGYADLFCGLRFFTRVILTISSTLKFVIIAIPVPWRY